jgi:hypothetical protein
MGRQTQLHVLPKDLNELLVALHDKEPLEAALRRGNSATPERLAFIPDNICGQSLVLWSERFAPNLQRRFVATSDSPYYLADEQTGVGVRVVTFGRDDVGGPSCSNPRAHLWGFSKQASGI